MPTLARRPWSARTCLGALVLGATLAAAAGPAAAAGADVPAEPAPGAELVLRTLSLLGVTYKLGGNSPDSGLDCSGLVRHVFHDTLGLLLPRRSEEMSRTGYAIDASQLRPGDLVFFNTLRRAFSHVGIYIGENRFVHAPARGGTVRVERLDQAYWSTRFNGARRVLADGSPRPAGGAGDPLQ